MWLPHEWARWLATFDCDEHSQTASAQARDGGLVPPGRTGRASGVFWADFSGCHGPTVGLIATAAGSAAPICKGRREAEAGAVRSPLALSLGRQPPAASRQPPTASPCPSSPPGRPASLVFFRPWRTPPPAPANGGQLRVAHLAGARRHRVGNLFRSRSGARCGGTAFKKSASDRLPMPTGVMLAAPGGGPPPPVRSG